MDYQTRAMVALRQGPANGLQAPADALHSAHKH